MRYSYVSILSTDSYLLGAIVLHKSLQDTKPKYPFHLLITPNLSPDTVNILHKLNIKTIKIDPIKNPILTDPKDRRYFNYSKLNMWGLSQFEKIVYLDADMIVIHNIDELFDKPNLSAVNAGGLVNKDWVQLNSGLMVIEPSQAVFSHMKSQVGLIEKVQGKGDQAFLHEYYADWPQKAELHLPHCYNIFDGQIDAYRKREGYYLDDSLLIDNNKYDPKRIKIIHYIGQVKPWNRIQEIKKLDKKDDETFANKLWVKYYRDMRNDLKDILKEIQ